MLKEEIGIRIKNIREGMKMSKEQFCKLLDISGQYLGMVERGKCCLSIEKLEKLCNLTNLPADYILFGKNCSISKETQSYLSKYTDEQIEYGCATLEQFALFMKHLKIS